MQSTHRPSMKSSALKKLTAAVASALVLSSAAHAAGLGKLTVLSALGQPLRAEIELTAVSSDEAAGLVAKLASPEAFRTANIEFNPALLSLRFAVEQRNGRQFIRVSSSQPLNEPFVDMLLELSWNNGRLVREYTFLLDPAELRATQSAQVAANEAASARPRADSAAPAAAAPAAPAAERPRRSRARAEEAAQAAAGSEPPVRSSRAAGSSSYRVKPGDSLGRIAAQLKPVDVSLDMMLVALYRANPDAFIGNNMNRLKSGRILSVPDTGSMQALNDGEAHGVVVAHAADFNAYRNKLAGQVGAAEPVKAPQAGQSAGGKITAKVEERPTAANESQDQLRLSKAPAAGAAAGKGATMGTEDTIAKQRELEEAQQRVKELERNVGDLEKLATIKSKGGAEAQQNAASAPAAPPANDKPAHDKPAHDKPAAKKLATIKPAAKPAPEPGLLDFILDNLALVGGGAAALLLGGLLVAQRRKKKVVKAVSEPSILGVPAAPAHSLFAETGGQSIDTSNSVFNSSFAPSASQLDTNEVDPVAEADVYIAYGRDAQAEEILKEALRTHPERYPVRLKLLEIYAGRKDQRAFETQAGELYSMTRGQGEEWAQAAALGISIDPLNPLYATGGAQADAAPASHEQARTLMSKDFDDAFGADLTATPAAAAAAAAGHEPMANEPMSFDQHFAGAMDAVQPAAQQETALGAAAQAEDEHTLDFDLGGLAFEPVQAEEPKRELPQHDDNFLDFDMGGFDAAPAAAPAERVEPLAAAAEAAAPAEEPLDFSFDMDFGAAAANPVPQPAVQPAETAEDLSFGDFDLDDHAIPAPAGAAADIAVPNSDFDMANLAREFDLPPLPAVPEETSPATELNDPLFDLDTMDFGLEPPVPAAAPAADPAPALSLEDELFGLPALPNAFPAELPSATPARADSAEYAPHGMLEPAKIEPAFDLDGFDLDLPGDVQALPELETVTAAAAPAEMSAAHMEMETKLDLAVAYQEIGDKEGARELLEEVIKGGSSEQVSKANAMRAQLA
ncbi:FimV/HubP family polar landmark protein [Massilia sp. LXY-6]|uniref:FimV/HubP family polar landmark protein n=1 Tax=Massilia sp. LXY-6 TaxID=3379823 RepID=UPI003EE0DEBE